MIQPIWSEAYLNQLATDAEQQINKDIQCIFEKQYIPITAGISINTLPSVVRSLKRITWRGRKLEPASWEELIALSPATIGGYIETSRSRPQWYAMHPTNPYDIRLYPTPDETFVTPNGLNPYGQLDNETACCISYWRDIDPTGTNPLALLPEYIDRRTRKAYILWRAFAQEGKGQNMSASAYYQKKYSFLIQSFRSINAHCFLASRYALGSGDIEVDNFRYPRPMLPSQFERVIY